MSKRIREKFGTAGLIVAIIALVVAVAGTAYAATKLNGTQKKEVEKISKKFAGKNGATGAPGTPGAKGDTGAQGTQGKAGSNGENGKSIALLNEAPPLCSEGGYTYEVEKSGNENEVCNGEEGPPGPEGVCGTASCHLPSGVIETGSWAFSVPAGYGAEILVPISLPIKLSSPIELPGQIHYQRDADFGTFCGGGVGNPQPINSGELCVYEGELSNTTFNAVYPSGGLVAGEFGRTGGALSFTAPTGAAQGLGSFAVKG